MIPDIPKRRFSNWFVIIAFFFLVFIFFPFFESTAQNDAPDEKAGAENSEYHYNPASKRDPFYSKILEEEENIAKSKNAFGLQKYDLTELKLGGIVWGSLGRKGVVETPEGKSYIIRVGTPIGKKGGMVKEITNKEVVILEFTTDYLGKRTSKHTVLKLQNKETDQQIF